MNKRQLFLKKNALSLILGLALVVVLLWVLTQRSIVGTEEVGYYPPVAVEGGAATSLVPGAPAQMQSGAEAIPAGTVTFCFRMDGQENKHMPALMGYQAQSVYGNGRSGTNWSLPPSATGSEDYGVLSDGRVFAKKAFLLQWGMQSYVEIKSDNTGWAAVRMQEATVGGEPAFISKD